MDKLDAAVRIGKTQTNILERPLNKGRNEVCSLLNKVFKSTVPLGIADNVPVNVCMLDKIGLFVRVCCDISSYNC